MWAEVRLESHLAKEGVGAESDGNSVDYQQHGQQQLEGRVSQQILDIHVSDELLHFPGILGEGRGTSFRPGHGRRPLPGHLLSENGGPWRGL